MVDGHECINLASLNFLGMLERPQVTVSVYECLGFHKVTTHVCNVQVIGDVEKRALLQQSIEFSNVDIY